jgi:hypothetical protein
MSLNLLRWFTRYKKTYQIVLVVDVNDNELERRIGGGSHLIEIR